MTATSIAGEAAAKAGRTDDAVRHYRTVAQRQLQTRKPPLGLFYAAEACRDAARLSDAELLYRQFLVSAPNHTLTHERLAFLTSVSGRRWESVPHYWALVRSGTATVEELVLFADLDRPVEQRPYLEDCERKSPGDWIVQLGLAAHALWDGESSNAMDRLKAIVSAMPESVAAQAMLGELLVNQPDREFLDWHRRLPPTAEDDPDIWYVRGLWARKRDRSAVAARCFWEAIRRAPTNRRAMFQWGQVLRSLDHPASEAVESRSRELIELTQFIDSVLRTESRRDEPFQKVATLLERMGRIWEAGAWGVVARNQFPAAAWPPELLTRVAGRLDPQLPLVVDGENLALRYDLSALPGFDSLLTSPAEPPSPDVRSPVAAIRFEETTNGPDFLYANGADPATPGARQFEQTGGGVAVLDFDGDRWPDLFFPQGGVWPTGENVPPPPGALTDRLFRNVGGQAAVDITAAAHLVDRGFGQGAAAGDFDNDGFRGLYVAHVGRNQLLHHNGDGTFSDVTDAAGLTADDWTTSCAIVDLNADGFPDLYDVNYLTGPRVNEVICDGKACSPSAFAGAPDRLLLSRGDGTFELVDPLSPEIDGKGLGVVAFDWQERGRPSLFIANDQVPNFLLRNHSTGDRRNIRLDDEAFISGVAFNQDGLAMASMGIAADDADGDGRIDFYVTTFKDEASLLFVQDAAGLFVERATPAGLRSATWPFVGWGTQFLDADCDGRPDLVAVNGHVDDYRDQNGEYHMRPQFFRNLDGGRFEELAAAQIGPFFDHKRLGRGLSRLDWNRDGLMDFAVSNIGDRASLVLNTTGQAGHRIAVRLTARQGARDAIGSVVDVRAGDRTWRKQLVAGDGYMASNERLLQFGLGEATEVTELTVHWPSGTTSTVQRLPAEGTLELVESAAAGIVWSDPQSPEVIAVTTGRER
ncbi:MAG: FG-GAP-like repeat-containing protein [Planctomycetaceae bacterium]|nr:FG-GAP-like repeat-containing protein [Planctomycetaceae bacterium]